MVVVSRKLGRKYRTNRVLHPGPVVCESIALSNRPQLLFLPLRIDPILYSSQNFGEEAMLILSIMNINQDCHNRMIACSVGTFLEFYTMSQNGQFDIINVLGMVFCNYFSVITLVSCVMKIANSTQTVTLFKHLSVCCSVMLDDPSNYFKRYGRSSIPRFISALVYAAYIK